MINKEEIEEIQVQDKYSAADILSGYLYQCQVALLESIKRLNSNSSSKFTIGIECLDDVSFLENGKPSKIIQVKHHVDENKGLSDMSVDIWKTAEIWCDRLKHKKITEDTLRYLVTTQTINEATASFYLQADQRDCFLAEELLLKAAAESIAKKTNGIRKKFIKIPHEKRINILKNTYIIGGNPLHQDIRKSLEKNLRISCPFNI